MNKFIIVIGLVLNFSLCLSQNTLFDRHYEFGTWTAGWSMVNQQDTAFIVIGSNDSLISAVDHYSAIVSKFDSIGELVRVDQYLTTDTAFFQSFNANSGDQFKSIIKTPDNNLLAVGLTQSYGATNYYDIDILLIKFNSNLDTLWSKAISHPSDTAFRPNQIINTSDGGYLICGWQNSFISPNVRAFLCKIDSSGNFQWKKSYSNLTFTSTIWSVAETSDHGFMCSGTTFNINQDGFATLFKVDSMGNFIQNIFTSLQPDSYGSKIIQTIDGNYLWSSLKPDGFNNYSFNFKKLSETGSLIWDKQFGLFKDGGPFGLLQNTDSTFIVSGQFGVPNQGGLAQGVVMKLDSNGDSLWSRLYGTLTDFGKLWDIAPCGEGGYVMCGETYCCNFTPGVGNTSSMWLVRTDSLGLLTGFNELVDIELNIILGLPYPNPASDFFEVSFTIHNAQLPDKGRKGVELLLFDNIGKQIASQTLPRGTDKARFEMSKFAGGTYLVVLSIDGYNAGSRRIVKL